MCNCRDRMTEWLEGHNAQLTLSQTVNKETGESARLVIEIPLKKINPRKRMTAVTWCDYCPWCGDDWRTGTAAAHIVVNAMQSLKRVRSEYDNSGDWYARVGAALELLEDAMKCDPPGCGSRKENPDQYRKQAEPAP